MTENCRIPEKPVGEASDDCMKRILRDCKTIAIVGLSDNPLRDSNMVARFLIDKGYRIIPVNPLLDEVLGLKAYPDLCSIMEPVDIVDVFRRLEAVPAIVDEALRIRPKAIWLQLGLVDNESAARAKSMGVEFVQSKCIKIEYGRLLG